MNGESGWSGIYNFTTQQLTDVSSVKLSPKDFSIGCYPNPFNPTTTIQYTLPVNSNVKIEIFNILGSHIKTLLNDVKSSGTYRISFSRSDLASGIYFYKIIATPINRIAENAFVRTGKMELLK